MTWKIIIEVMLLGLALSMDAFAVSITDGLTYIDINKKKSFFIAGVFGFFQGLMPLIGFFLVYGVVALVGRHSGEQVGKIVSLVVTYIAFALLLIIGTKMLVDSIKSLRLPKEEKKEKMFSYKEVLLYGIATSIDALGTGVALEASISNASTIWLHAAIIMIITFSISLIGLFLGKKITKLLKGKYEITGIIGGIILICLSAWILLSHYLGL